MNILEQLGFKNVELGDIQSVSGMSIIPILGNDLTDEISSPEKVHFLGTRNYGSIKLENDDDKIGIFPSHSTMITSESAQDHCTSKPILLKPTDKAVVDDCCCIQRSQGGYINDMEQVEYSTLPLGLRKKLFDISLRKTKDYSKLWIHIARWKYDFSRNTESNLYDVFKEYDKNLNEFVASFEDVENQLGSLIFFNDQLAGIEIMPTNKHWKFYWKRLIRGCYGLERLRLAKLNEMVMKKFTYTPNKENDLLLDIQSNISTLKEKLITNVALKIEGYVKTDKIDCMQNSLIYTVNNTPIGDVIHKEENSVYASLCII